LLRPGAIFFVFFSKWLALVENRWMNKHPVQLSATDREALEALIAKGTLPVKVYRRAVALLALDAGQTYTAVAATVKVTVPALSTLAHR
jgi:hypothetical protein